MQPTRQLIFLGSVALLLGIVGFALYGPHQEQLSMVIRAGLSETEQLVAGVFFVESRSIAQLQTKHAAVSDSGKRIRILIVPGHEPTLGGTSFAHILERDIVVDLALELQRLLSADPHFSVIVSRTREAWHPTLETYFDQHRDDIREFRQDHLDEMGRLVRKGLIREVTLVSHNNAPRDVALRLYGINAWANEQHVDIVLHLHINDHERSSVRRAGTYSGFSIYVPERQYSNSTSSRAIADHLFDRLSTILPPSDMPLEKGGIVEDQELIAIGRYNTVDAPSMLIEYGYIYEAQYQEESVRDVLVREYAYQTYRGIQDFFASSTGKQVQDTTLVPFSWQSDKRQGGVPTIDAVALQRVLRDAGLYPPPGKSINDCPLAGVFGACTATALRAFQREQGIEGEDGFLGPETRRVLNEQYAAPRAST